MQQTVYTAFWLKVASCIQLKDGAENTIMLLSSNSSRAAARCIPAGFKHLADRCTFAGIACLLGLQRFVFVHGLNWLTAVYTITNSRPAVLAGVCLAAMTLLEFGKPIWVWVGLCVALATWQKERWNTKSGSAAVAAVICSMYALTMQLVTSAAYWNECLWREIRISNSVFQGVVRVMESSAEVLSHETAKGGIEFVGLLVSGFEAHSILHVRFCCAHVHQPASAHVMSDLLVSHCSSVCLAVEKVVMQ